MQVQDIWFSEGLPTFRSKTAHVNETVWKRYRRSRVVSAIYPLAGKQIKDKPFGFSNYITLIQDLDSKECCLQMYVKEVSKTSS